MEVWFGLVFVGLIDGEPDGGVARAEVVGCLLQYTLAAAIDGFGELVESAVAIEQYVCQFDFAVPCPEYRVGQRLAVASGYAAG